MEQSPEIGDLNDRHETAEVKDERILENNMGIISDSHASPVEKLYGNIDKKHEALYSTSEKQIHQATSTKENTQDAVYGENVGIKKL